MKELQIINNIKKRTGEPPKGVKVGIGDDCAVLDYSKDKYLLWASDMLLEGTHFILKKASYKQIGRKAAAVNISDIAAMGGVPKYITVSLGIPPRTSSRAVEMIYDGIEEVCSLYRVKVVGGDTNKSKSLIIDISIERKTILISIHV